MKFQDSKINLDVIVSYQNNEQVRLDITSMVDDEKSAYGVWKDIVRDILSYIKYYDVEDATVLSFCYYTDDNKDALVFVQRVAKEALQTYGGRVLLHHGLETDYRDEVTKDIIRELNFDIGYKEAKKVA